METPEVRFADSDGLSIAWQEWGSGPITLVVPALVSNVEVTWEHEYFRRSYELASEYVRSIQFDKRGVGLSDKIVDAPTLEERIHDIAAVLDAAGAERASLVGLSEGGLMAQLFAAMHPDRVDKLVLVNSSPGATAYRSRPELIEQARNTMQRFDPVFATWGQDAHAFVEWFSPSNAGNEAFVRWVARLQRLSSTESEIRRQLASLVWIDAWELLPDITAETLVINARGDQVIPSVTGEMLADRIPNATHRYVESDNHFHWLGHDWLDAFTPIVEFVSGVPVVRATERRFATIVFTDIVGSSSATVASGDDGWRTILDQHDRLAFALCDEHGGVIVKTTGDGVLARFELPSTGLEFARTFRARTGDLGLRVRAGVHCGEIEIRENRDITGVAVNLAARVEQAAPDGAVFVSPTVRNMMLGGSTVFEDRGEYTLKGFDEPWRLYELVDC